MDTSAVVVITELAFLGELKPVARVQVLLLRGAVLVKTRSSSNFILLYPYKLNMIMKKKCDRFPSNRKECEKNAHFNL